MAVIIESDQKKRAGTGERKLAKRPIKKVALEAYFDANLGDDLFLHILCRRYPHIQFYARGKSDGGRGCRNLKNLHFWAYDAPCAGDLVNRGLNFLFRKILRRKDFDYFLDSCDLRLLISGSCFMQASGPATIAWHDRFINENTAVIGCNFGPYDSQQYLRTYRRILGRARDVCFRDRYSYDLFKDAKQVRWAPDIVFTYEERALRRPKQSGYVLISVAPVAKDGRHDLAEYEELYENWHTALINALTQKGKKVLLLSFCQREDAPIAQRLMHTVRDGHAVRMIHYPQITADEAVGYVANAASVVATRYHATILALRFEKPVYSVCYSDKTVHVLQDLNCGLGYCTPGQLAQTDPQQVIRQLEHKYDERQLQRLRRAAREAQRQFQWVDSCLSNEEKGKNAGMTHED